MVNLESEGRCIFMTLPWIYDEASLRKKLAGFSYEQFSKKSSIVLFDRVQNTPLESVDTFFCTQ